MDASVWVTNGAVGAIVADGRTLFVGGAFTRVGPASGGGVPISASTFAPPAGFPRVVGSVTAVAPDGAGGWYIGGQFTSVGGVPRQNLAHITGGLAVDSWSPSVDALVLAIVVTPADVILGGTFTTVNGLARPRLARLSRTTGQPNSWVPAPDDRVSSLAADGTTLYVAGAFTTVALAPRAGLAAFTLATGALTTWDPAATTISPPLAVETLALANRVVYVGGDFDHIGGQERAGSAALLPGSAAATRWNPSLGFPLDVTRLLPLGDRIVLAADFTSPGVGLAAVDTATGAVFPYWTPTLYPLPGSTGRIRALAALDGRVAVGGSFAADILEGVFTGDFAVFDTASSVPLVAPEPPSDVWALARQGATLFVGGQFTTFSRTACRNLVAIDAVTGQASAWTPDATEESVNSGLGSVSALAADSSRVYAVVTFTDPQSGVPRSHVRAFSRANAGLLWQAECDRVVSALAHRAGVLYAGGAFDSLAGPRQNLAALDAATGALTPWAPAPNGAVRALLAMPAALAIGGDFTGVGVQSRARLAQLDYASGAPASWNPGADNTVWALAGAGSTLFAGGDFAHAGALVRARVAALDLGGNAALPWNPGADGTVRALVADGANVYAGGAFLLFSGQPMGRFVRVSAVTGAPLAWGAQANGPVNALALANAHIFMGGAFSAVDREPVSGLAGVFDPTQLAVEPPAAPPSARIAVGPSPLRGSGQVSFTLDHDAPVWLRVFDVSGRVARTLIGGEPRRAGRQRVELDRAGLPPGVYQLHLEAGGTRTSARFVVVP